MTMGLAMARRLRSPRILARGGAGTALLVALLVGYGPEAHAHPVTPQLIDAAKKEAQVNFYCSADLPVCEKVARGFEAKYPGITVKVERSGSERLFQRIGQEAQTRIHNADVVNTSDSSHFLLWKRDGMLAKWVPEDVEKHYPPEGKDKDGYFAIWRSNLNVLTVNKNTVKPEDVPKGYLDLLKPEWKDRIAKAHPGYSGTVVTITHTMTKMLGWDYFEKLAKQNVMQVQSATEPARKVAVGERAVSLDSMEYAFSELAKGAPLLIVYPEEEAPRITSPAAVLERAPHPNAARLFASYLFTPEAQQTIIDIGWVRSMHPQTRPAAGMKPVSELKVVPENAEEIEKSMEEIKRRYTRIFGT